MAGRVQKKLIRHIDEKELDDCINKKEKEVKVLRKLYFIRLLYNDEKIETVSEKCGISLPTAHSWLDRWNEEGYDGLFPKYSNCGRSSKLSDEDKEKLNKILEQEDYLNMKKVAKILKDDFDVKYCLSQQSVVLKSLGFHYSKPYQMFSKRPDDAEDVLKKTKKCGFR
jgi:putative transposase